MADVEPWELHSELVLVSPEVFRRALELLPERDPDGFLAMPREIVAVPAEETPTLATAVVQYTFWRVRQSARFALALAVGAVGFALIAELVH